MIDLNALAERLERDTQDAVGDLRHAIAIASQAQPDWRSTWEAALAELMPSQLDRQAAQALRGMGEPVAWRFKARDGYGSWSFADHEPTYLNPTAYVIEPLARSALKGGGGE